MSNTQDNQQKMTIWVDADSCPKIARDLLIKTAIRTQTKIVFVSVKRAIWW